MNIFTWHKNSVNNRWRQHQYLWQLVATCVLFILLPCILSLIVVSHQTYQKLTDTYKDYYQEASEKFAKYFTKQLNEICVNSYTIADDSRKTNNKASQLDESLIIQQSFYMYPATEVIAEYAKSSRLFGIYYYGIDRILTRQSSFSSQSFYNDYLKVSGSLSNDSVLANFFANGDENLVFYPDGSNNLYVGVRVTIGTNRNPALLIYTLDSTSIDLSLLLSNDYHVAQFTVFNTSKVPIISFGNEYSATLYLQNLIADQTSEEPLSSASIWKNKDDDYIIGSYWSPSLGFTFMIIAPFNHVTSGTKQFYKTLMNTMVILIVILIGAAGLLIYINYHPISELLRKLDKSEKNENEFDIITEEINRMTNEISQQNMIIVDSLLGNILYGIPISEKKIHCLGIPTDSRNFFVFTLFSATINTTQRTEIVTNLLQNFSTKTFITDILLQNLTVLICISSENKSTEIYDYLIKALQTDSKKTVLRCGITVESLNDIKASFDSCFSSPFSVTGQNSLTQTYDPSDILVQKIMQFIKNHYTDPSLSQSVVADYFKISTYSLSRLFKNKSDISFTEYITNMRIELAKKKLIETDDNVADISTQVGIPNLNYFYKVFKNAVGISPAKYRSKPYLI